MTDDQPEDLETRARDLLTRLLQAAHGGQAQEIASAEMRPQEADCERVFDQQMAFRLQQAYAPFWASGRMAPTAKSHQTAVVLWTATGAELQQGTGDADQFPGGYRKVAQWIQPEPTWVRWKFVRPGERLGMAYDGLVWIDDHWAWFPKPWRAVRMAGTVPPEA